MPDLVHLIPLAEIDDDALPRDRIELDAAPLMELRLSISANGLRMPVELFALPEPRGEARYGIVSGFRRIAAFRAQLEFTSQERYRAIPAFLREPADFGAALASMVEENEIRADISPWERGRILMVAREAGAFPSIEEAVERLYRSADRTKRARLRSIAYLVEALDGALTAPEKLSQRQLIRLAQANSRGMGEVMAVALTQARDKDPDAQWEILKPILAESERWATAGEPDLDTGPAPSLYHRGRPRRILRPRPQLTIRREMARDGYILRFTGKEATSGLLDEVLDQIEMMYSP